MEKPLSYCDIEIRDKNNNLLKIFNCCYFKYTYRWIRGARGQIKMLPWLESINIMNCCDEPLLIEFDLSECEINLIDQYIFDGDKKLSIFNNLISKYIEICQALDDSYGYPVPKVNVYLD